MKDFYFFLRIKDEIILSLLNIKYSLVYVILWGLMETIFWGGISFWLCYFSNREFEIIFVIHSIFFITISIMYGTVFVINTIIPLITNYVILKSFSNMKLIYKFIKKIYNFLMINLITRKMFFPFLFLGILSFQKGELFSFFQLILLIISIFLLKQIVNVMTLLQNLKLRKEFKRNISLDFVITTIMIVILTLIVEKFPLDTIIQFLININFSLYLIIIFFSLILVEILFKRIINILKDFLNLFL